MSVAPTVPVPGTVVGTGAGVGPGGDQGLGGPQGLVGPTGPAGPTGATGPLADAEIGSIKAWPAAAAPNSWHLCDGAAVSRTLYPDLYALIGTSYGPGDGSTTFNLPDMRGRMALGLGQGTGLTNRVLAAIGGEETHQLTIAELAAHTHVQSGHAHTVWGYQPVVGTAGQTITALAGASGAGNQASSLVTAVNQNTGSDGAHNTMPPFLVITYIIKMSLTGGATAQAPIADTTQPGLVNKLSGLTTDYVGGDNACHDLGTNVVSAIGSLHGDEIYLRSDVPGGVGDAWTLGNSGAAGAVSAINTADFGDGHHGVAQVAPGTVAASWARILGNYWFLRASTFTFRAWVNPYNLVATDPNQVQVGFSNNPGPSIVATAYYIIFYFIPNGAATWHAYCRNAAAVTDLDTGVTATIGAWFDLMIVATATSVQFYINGTLVQTITTNIFAATQAFYDYASINTASGTLNRSLMVDKLELLIKTGVAGRYLRNYV